uniref:interferon-stimulated 20 kDa exonuclease-like 2 n=1 Tax=Scatophagus argus TaxID=75038 RepID=UPI001ED8606E|nr:interferon-stimulated 20 kDa exonuclease-like 2 [Scatophagus argus]XP_046254890.1 interferon-stimulated 20 kDa exonuclease-like 2 [Scatophagus argus]
MSDSGIMINLNYSGKQGKAPGGNQKKNKKKRFQRKMQYLERKGYVEAKHKYNHRKGRSRQGQSPRQQNGASAGHPSRPTSTHCSPKPSASPHRLPPPTVTGNRGSTSCPSASSDHKASATQTPGNPSKYLTIDCEMVGSGLKGSISQLARCSVVNYEGDVVYDKFIKPPVPVTDYRSRWSGIRPRDLVNATPYAEARKEILKLLAGKVVIGHAIHNDFKVLGYSHPAALTRDTSRIPLLNTRAGFAEHECASLKRLSKAILNRDIQAGKRGHSSVEDARATMELYKVVEVEWEGQLASGSQARM